MVYYDEKGDIQGLIKILCLKAKQVCGDGERPAHNSPEWRREQKYFGDSQMKNPMTIYQMNWN